MKHLALWLGAGVLLSAASPAASMPAVPAPGLGQRDAVAHNDPSLCPYCHGDEELMRAAGIVSHGGFAFGREDTAALDAWMATIEIKWIETPHFEIGIGLSPYKVPQAESGKIRAEAARLREVLPDVPSKPKVLDPWLRAHLYALRAEDLWEHFIELVGLDDLSVLPDGTRTWDMRGKYMGEGPYLGMKGKYEILLLESEAISRQYLEQQYGVINYETQRWHVPDLGTLSLTAHTQAGRLRRDAALHGHLAFNLGHNFLDGYKHYAYETPVWPTTSSARSTRRTTPSTAPRAPSRPGRASRTGTSRCASCSRWATHRTSRSSST